VGRVAAGTIAKKLLRTRWGVEILACVIQVQDLCAAVDPEKVNFAEIEANPVRCPDPPCATTRSAREGAEMNLTDPSDRSGIASEVQDWRHAAVRHAGPGFLRTRQRISRLSAPTRGKYEHLAYRDSRRPQTEETFGECRGQGHRVQVAPEVHGIGHRRPGRYG